MQKNYSSCNQYTYSKESVKVHTSFFTYVQETNRLTNIPKKKSRRDVLGIFKNKIRMSDDFDDEL